MSARGADLMAARPLDTRTVTVPGPEGPLEGVLDVAHAQPDRLAVVCHPHPLHGGTMHNKVTHTLARTLSRLGARSLRFNFRGVGASAGSHASGDGEVGDALAAARWLRAEWPGLELYLAGFSFGANVAIRATAEVDCAGLVTVAPPVVRLPADFRRPACPWLLVQGTDDEIVDAEAVARWVERLDDPPALELVEGAGHFFHGRLADLGRLVEAFLTQARAPAAEEAAC